MKQLIEQIDSGVSVNAVDVPRAVGEIGVLKTSCVSTGAFNAQQNKTVHEYERDRVACPVVAGRIIVSRMNTPHLVGAAGLVREPVDSLYLPDRLWQVTVRPDVSAGFLSHWMQTRVYRDQVASAGVGTSASMQNISQGDLRNVTLTIPHVVEQRAIADYLDRETTRIDTLIHEQQRLVEMLRERRATLRTNHALQGTRACDTVRSPLPWANHLPASWPIVPLTSVARLESGHTPSRTREDWWQDCYIPWISLNDVGSMRESKYIESTINLLSDEGIANSSARLLPASTVVLSRDATVGRASIMRIPMATSQHFAAWICGPRLDPEYLWTLFADAMQPYFASFQNGSTIRTIGMGDLKAFRIPLPPLDEQRRIVAYLDEQTTKIDALIAEAGRFIELSRERRAASITAAVTGQIDVRDEAA